MRKLECGWWAAVGVERVKERTLLVLQYDPDGVIPASGIHVLKLTDDDLGLLIADLRAAQQLRGT